MKLKQIFLIVILFYFLVTRNYQTNGQISIRADVVESAVVKPQDYDSLINFSHQINPLDYYRFIGQKLYFLPFSKKFYKNDSSYLEIKNLYSRDSVSIRNPHRKAFHETEIAKVIKKNRYDEAKKVYDEGGLIKTNVYSPVYNVKRRYFYSNRDSISGNYFTILDIEGTEKSASYLSTFKKMDAFKAGDKLVLKVTLRKEITRDTIYWIYDTNVNINPSPFLLLPYFIKQKNVTEKKVLVSYQDLNQLVDINTGNLFNLNQNEKVVCTEVTLIESENSPYLEPNYILKTIRGMEFKVPLNSNFIENRKFGLYEMFTTLEQYELMEYKKRVSADEIEKQKIAAKEVTKRIGEGRQKSLRMKYGEKIGNLIYESKVFLGMTKEMCVDSWGKPLEVNRTIVNGLTHEQWVYGYKNYLYFDNSKFN